MYYQLASSPDPSKAKQLQALTGLSQDEANALLAANDGDANRAVNAYSNSQMARPAPASESSTGRVGDINRDPLQRVDEPKPNSSAGQLTPSVSAAMTVKAKQLQVLTGLSEVEAGTLLAANNGNINRAANNFLNSQVAMPASDSQSSAGAGAGDRNALLNRSEPTRNIASSSVSESAATPTTASAPSHSPRKHEVLLTPFPPLQTWQLKESLNCRIPTDLAQLDLLQAWCVQCACGWGWGTKKVLLE